MEIIGRGFLARHLRRIAAAHPGVVVIAAGVSAASGTSRAQFDREASVVHEVVRRCQADGSRLVFFSTASTGIYGAPECHGREDRPAVPQTPYGRHKLALEAMIAASGVDRLMLRLGHVVGPDQPPHQLLPALARQVLAGEVTLHRGGRRDLVDIADVVAIIDHLLAVRSAADLVNIASGVPVPVEDIVSAIEAGLGVSARRRLVDVPPANYVISTRRLRALVPAVDRMGFSADYYRALIDKYLRSAVSVDAAAGG